MISGSQAISRLSFTVTVWRRIRRSRSEMWRRSSRRCRVMPSAPPNSASAAAQNRVRLVGPPGLADGGHVVDIDAKLGHGGDYSRSAAAAGRSRLPGGTSEVECSDRYSIVPGVSGSARSSDLCLPGGTYLPPLRPVRRIGHLLLGRPGVEDRPHGRAGLEFRHVLVELLLRPLPDDLLADLRLGVQKERDVKRRRAASRGRCESRWAPR